MALKRGFKELEASHSPAFLRRPLTPTVLSNHEASSLCFVTVSINVIAWIVVPAYFTFSPLCLSSNPVIPTDQPLAKLEISDTFQGLTTEEKLYAHFMSRASFLGGICLFLLQFFQPIMKILWFWKGLIILLQTSIESPDIFRLIHKINLAESADDLRKSSLENGVNEVEFRDYLAYCAGTSKWLN